MKKTLVLLLIGCVIFFMASKDSLAAKGAKKGKSAISQEDMDAMSSEIDVLTKKVYSNSLFSPLDNAKMIEIKIKLDNQMLIAPDTSFAPLYYKAANLYKAREYKQEAIECFQTILENFPDTALAPKASQALASMGVKVFDPDAAEGDTTGQAAPNDAENAAPEPAAESAEQPAT
jgi:tetratricopeptide (TPR) repeat protein